MTDIAKILLPNRFDYGYHTEFQQKCTEFIADATEKVLICDFSRVEYLDSAALGMLMLWQRRVAAANKKVMLKGAKGATAKILTMANMQKIFEFI